MCTHFRRISCSLISILQMRSLWLVRGWITCPKSYLFSSGENWELRPLALRTGNPSSKALCPNGAQLPLSWQPSLLTLMFTAASQQGFLPPAWPYCIHPLCCGQRHLSRRQSGSWHSLLKPFSGFPLAFKIKYNFPQHRTESSANRLLSIWQWFSTGAFCEIMEAFLFITMSRMCYWYLVGRVRDAGVL